VLLKGEFTYGDVKFDKVQVSSKDELAVELSNTTLVPGAKLTFKGKDASRAAGSNGVDATVGVEYKAGNLFTTLEANVLDTAALPVEATALFSYDGFLLGAQVKVGLRKVAEPSDYNVLAGYKAKGVAFALQTDKKASGVTAALLQEVSKEVSVAGLATFKVAAPGAFDVATGLSYKPSADATVHAKVNTKGRVGLSFAHVLSPLAKLTLSADLDAANIASDDHKLGVLVNFTA
jgi:hypothetical protein